MVAVGPVVPSVVVAGNNFPDLIVIEALMALSAWYLEVLGLLALF